MTKAWLLVFNMGWVPKMSGECLLLSNPTTSTYNTGFQAELYVLKSRLNLMSKKNWWSVPLIHLYLFLSDRLSVQDHHQSLRSGVRRAPSAAPLSASLHHLHPVGLLRDGRGDAVRGGPSAQSPQQPQLLSFYCPTGAFYRWDMQHFFFFFTLPGSVVSWWVFNSRFIFSPYVF